MTLLIGFDSAWTDDRRKPGAICALTIDDASELVFHPPEMATFDQALALIRARTTDGPCLVAIDQSTVVPNATGSRPVERVAASVISWMGGGVQPSSRSRVGMFDDDAPIWRFLKALGAMEDPERARSAISGLWLMEVFPALALASLDAHFFARHGAPKYNPSRRKTFRPTDWPRVTEAAAREAERFGICAVAAWCHHAGRIEKPVKADQDRLDAVLCLLVALRWRMGPRETSMLLGDPATGCMVLPCAEPVRRRLEAAAQERGVPVDGTLSKNQPQP